MAFSGDNPLTYTGTNASFFIKQVDALGYVLEGAFPQLNGQAFSIREVNTTGPIYRIEEGDSVWPAASGFGLTHDKTASTQRKMRDAACDETRKEDPEARRSALQRILRLGSGGGRHARSQLIADLNVVGAGDDEITEALRVAWLTFGDS